MIRGADNRRAFVNGWVEEIKAGKRFRKKHSHSKRWKDFRKYYRGQWKKEIIPVNRIFSYGRSLIPQVYFQNPRVMVTAKRPELLFHARVVEAVDNHLIQEAMLKGTLKSAILTAYLCGTAPIKLGYDSEFGYTPDQAMDKDSATVTQIGRKEGRKIEYQVGVRPGMPWALGDLPEHIIIPAGYRDPNSLPWIAHRIMRPLDDIKQDQKYQNTKDLTGTRRMELDDDRQLKLFTDGDHVVFGELWEIRDTRTREIHVICEDQLLMSQADALQIEGLPWEFLIFNEDPEHFWGIPDVSMVEQQQLELNEIRTQARRHRQVALLKFLYLKGAISKKQLEAFLSGEVGPAVEVDGESLASAIMTIQPHIPPDLAPEAARVAADMRESLGFDENTSGAFVGGTPPTASETMRVGQVQDRRIAERRDIVGDILTNIVRKWNQYIFSFWTGSRVIQITGPDGVQQWMRYSGEQLRGEYTLRIDAESGFPINQQTRLEASGTLLKAFGGDQMVDQATLKRQFLEQFEWIFPGISQAVKFMNPQIAELLAQERQPHPMMGGGRGNRAGSNQGGGRGGSSPDRPLEFEQARKQFQQAGG